MSLKTPTPESSAKDPNKYKIICQRYDPWFREETVVLYQGAILSQMLNLYDTVKKRQGSNMIKVSLVKLDGEEVESYP